MTTLYTGNTIGFMHNNAFLTADKSHPNFESIVSLVQQGELDDAADLVDLKTAVRVAITGSKMELRGNSMYLGNEEVRGILGERILEMMRLGFDCTPLELFVSNLTDNPSKRAVDELYGFLEVSKLPITSDGCFLAYKSVKADFTDHYTGTMDNSPGSLVEMQRNKVDEDKDRTCSYGLHFAAHEYASSFYGSGKMVVVKINPRDVVAIPSDYQNQKGRCCAYEVLNEVKRDNTDLVGSIIAGFEGVECDDTPTFDDDCWIDGAYGIHFVGDSEEFPTDTQVPYILTNEVTGKERWDWFFVSYDFDNDNLLFRKHDGEEFDYCTIADLNDWSIDTYVNP